MKIGLFPGQEEALREEYARLKMLGRRRFLYLLIGTVVGTGTGSILGYQLRSSAAPLPISPIQNPDLARAQEISRGPSDILRKEAGLLAAMFSDYPHDPILLAGVIRLADLVVNEPPSPERRMLAAYIIAALRLSPDNSFFQNSALFARLTDAAKHK